MFQAIQAWLLLAVRTKMIKLCLWSNLQYLTIATIIIGKVKEKCEIQTAMYHIQIKVQLSGSFLSVLLLL